MSLRRVVLPAAALVTLATLPHPAAAGSERLSLDFRLARQAERFQSHEADSLGLSVSFANVGMIAFDFHVMDVPMKAQRPSLHVTGRALTSERVFVAATSGQELTLESPMLELYGGVGFAVPLGIVDGTDGAELTLGYEGGVVITRDTGENFIQISNLAFGVAQTDGAFAGTAIEVTYGHNDLFGPSAAAKRWGARAMLQAGLMPRSPAPTAHGASRAPLRAFLEIALETDGRPGPDSLGLRGGLAFDAGSILARPGTPRPAH